MNKTNIAVVFDTNFIISHIRDLKEINKKLREQNYTPFITQISINERVSQKYIKLRSEYEKLDKLKEEFIKLAEIKELQDFDEKFKIEEDNTLKGYKTEFPNEIIAFSPNKYTLESIMERVYKKLPPFVEGESDRGFKDTLLWFSLLDYFSESPYSEIIFITDDKGFGNGKSTDKLCSEFENKTRKKISIHKNKYYLHLIGENEIESKNEDVVVVYDKITLNDSKKNNLREKINSYINNIMFITEPDYWGNIQKVQTFTTEVKFDDEYIKSIFSLLPDILENSIFQNELEPSKIFDLDNRIKNQYMIPIENIENLNNLHSEIKEKYADYLKPFYIAIASKFNQLYQPSIDKIDYEIPF